LHWPAFNVADSLVCVGAGLLLWFIFKEEQSQDVSHPV
jgi:lipoprotein signal peptidase